jgi:hypothetical protein
VFIVHRGIRVMHSRTGRGDLNAFRMPVAVTESAVLERTVRFVRKIVRARAATICAPRVNRAAIVQVIAVRVVAMVNATMGKRVRAATRIAAHVRCARTAYARRVKIPPIARTTVLQSAAMARAA